MQGRCSARPPECIGTTHTSLNIHNLVVLAYSTSIVSILNYAFLSASHHVAPEIPVQKVERVITKQLIGRLHSKPALDRIICFVRGTIQRVTLTLTKPVKMVSILCFTYDLWPIGCTYSDWCECWYRLDDSPLSVHALNSWARVGWTFSMANSSGVFAEGAMAADTWIAPVMIVGFLLPKVLVQKVSAPATGVTFFSTTSTPPMSLSSSSVEEQGPGTWFPPT